MSAHTRAIALIDECGQVPNGIPIPDAFDDLRQSTLVIFPSPCPSISNPPVPNVITTVSQGTFNLSEIASGLPGVSLTDPNTQGPLHDFLAQNLCFGPHAYGTLVVDEEWVISQPIVLQPRTTLTGVGRAGRGMIVAADLPPGSGAIELYPGASASAGHVVIRDLYITNGGPRQLHCGIKISSASELRIENCLIQNFRVGIFAEKTVVVWLDKIVVGANRNGIVLNGGNSAWRVRDCTLNTNSCWGVVVFGHADGPDPYPGQDWGWGNDFLFSGCRIEGNGSGGVYFGGIYGVFDGIHFEGNGPNNAGPDLMIRVDESELDTGFFGFKNTGQVKVLSSFLGQGRVRMLFAPSNTPLTPSAPGVTGQQAHYHIEAEYNMYYWGPDGEPFRAPMPWNQSMEVTMARSDFVWVNFDTQFNTANPQATRSFQIEGMPLAGQDFYLLIQGLDVNLPGQQILINGIPQPDPDIPPQEGKGRWTTWMDRIPPDRLHSGTNTVTIVAAKSSVPGSGPVVVTDPFFVANVAIHWREGG